MEFGKFLGAAQMSKRIAATGLLFRRSKGDFNVTGIPHPPAA
jgi:hypothetical protein